MGARPRWVSGSMAVTEHRFAKRHLDPFVDGELRGEVVDRVASHLAECPDCSDEVCFLLSIRAALFDMSLATTAEGIDGS